MDKCIRTEFTNDVAKIIGEYGKTIGEIIVKNLTQIINDVNVNGNYDMRKISDRYNIARILPKFYLKNGCEYCNELFYEFSPETEKGYLSIGFYIPIMFKEQSKKEKTTCTINDSCIALSKKMEEIVFYFATYTLPETW